MAKGSTEGGRASGAMRSRSAAGRLGTGVGLLLLAVVLSGVPSASAQLNIIPAVDIECGSTTLDISVAPGSTRTAIASCVATNPTLYSEVVQLDMESELSSSLPGSLTLAAGAEEAFTITFTAPAGVTAMGTYEATLNYTITTINQVPYIIGQAESMDFDVRIAQFAALRTGVDTTRLDAKGGEWAQTTVSIWNDGNGADTFEITLDVHDQLTADGWTIEINPTRVSVAAGRKGTATLRVQPPAGDTVIDRTVEVLVTSEYSVGQSGLPVEEEMLMTWTRLSADGSTTPAGEDGNPLWRDGPTAVTWVLAGGTLAIVVVVLALSVIRRSRRQARRVAAEIAARRARRGGERGTRERRSASTGRRRSAAGSR